MSCAIKQDETFLRPHPTWRNRVVVRSSVYFERFRGNDDVWIPCVLRSIMINAVYSQTHGNTHNEFEFKH